MKPKNTHIKYGLIIAAVLIVIYLLLSYTGLKHINAANYLPSLALTLLSMLNVLNYNRLCNGELTFGNAFAYGFKSIAVTTIIMIIYSVISATLLFPEMKEIAYQETIKALQQQGNTLPADIERTAKENVNRYYIPLSISSALMSTLITGALGAVIGAALSKKKSSDINISQ